MNIFCLFSLLCFTNVGSVSLLYMKKNNKTKINKNKIKKNITKKKSNPKKKIIQKIISEWKKQTNGIVKIDTSTVYKNDYYLIYGHLNKN